MRDIALFLISSILTPATLASGQVMCLLATQIEVVTPLPAGETTKGLTVVSNSSGNCLARTADLPLRPVAAGQTTAPPLVAKKPRLADVMEHLALRLGLENEGLNAASFVSGSGRMNYDRSTGLNVNERAAGYASSTADRDNAVVRF